MTCLAFSDTQRTYYDWLAAGPFTAATLNELFVGLAVRLTAICRGLEYGRQQNDHLLSAFTCSLADAKANVV